MPYHYNVIYNETPYQVTVGTRKNAYPAVEVNETSERNATGILANVMAERGVKLVSVDLYETSQDEQNEVILACGYRFSKSEAWKSTWDRLYRKGGRDKRWEKKPGCTEAKKQTKRVRG